MYHLVISGFNVHFMVSCYKQSYQSALLYLLFCMLFPIYSLYSKQSPRDNIANTSTVIEQAMQYTQMVHLLAHIRQVGQLFVDMSCPSLADRCIRHNLGLMRG